MKKGSWSWVRHSTFATLNKNSEAMTVSLGARGVFTLKRCPSKRNPQAIFRRKIRVIWGREQRQWELGALWMAASVTWPEHVTLHAQMTTC